MRSVLTRKVVQVFAATALLGVIGGISLWVQQPLLVASLGSAAFVQLMTPTTPSARIWPTLVGQLCGVASGFVGVYAATAASAPSFTADHRLVLSRLLAAALATALTGALQLGLKAVSAAGATLALLVALGAETPNLAGAVRLVLGVVLVTGLGEAARRAILAADG